MSILNMVKHFSKKKSKVLGFTIIEFVISAITLGVIATLTLPNIAEYTQQSDKFSKKTLSNLEEVVNELYNDLEAYPHRDNLGFRNTSSVTKDGYDYSGNSKFCKLFASKFIGESAAQNINCAGGLSENTDISNVTPSFTTDDGVKWWVEESAFPNGHTIVYVDVDNRPKSSNCLLDYNNSKYPDIKTCAAPNNKKIADRFMYYINYDGTISIRDGNNSTNSGYSLTIDANKVDGKNVTKINNLNSYGTVTIKEEGNSNSTAINGLTFGSLKKGGKYTVSVMPNAKYYTNWANDNKKITVSNKKNNVLLEFYPINKESITLKIEGCLENDLDNCITVTNNKTGSKVTNKDNTLRTITLDNLATGTYPLGFKTKGSYVFPNKSKEYVQNINVSTEGIFYTINMYLNNGKCPIGQYYSASEKKCKKCTGNALACKEDSGQVSGMCALSCKSGYYLINCSCIACPTNCAACRPTSGKCISCKNEGGKKYEVCQNGTCGEVKGGKLECPRLCKPKTCGGNEYYDYNNCKCVCDDTQLSCGAFETPNTTECKCISTCDTKDRCDNGNDCKVCGNNETLDKAACECKCIEGYTKCDGKCIKKCESGKTLNTSTCKCESRCNLNCTGNTKPNDTCTACVCDESKLNCTGNFIKNTAGGACECKCNLSCGAFETLDAAECKCISGCDTKDRCNNGNDCKVCGNNATLDKAACECKCIEGYTKCNGECIKKCENGKTLNTSTCKCEESYLCPKTAPSCEGGKVATCKNPSTPQCSAKGYKCGANNKLACFNKNSATCCSCNAGTQLCPKNNLCQTCDSSIKELKVSGTKCTCGCKEECPAGQKQDSKTCACDCTANQKNACKSTNNVELNIGCKCVCKSDFKCSDSTMEPVFNKNKCECQCKSGYLQCTKNGANKGKCIKCDGNTQKLDNSCGCVCKNNKQEMKNGKCICKASLKTNCEGSGGKLNSSTCDCDCSSKVCTGGKVPKLNSGKCECVVPNECGISGCISCSYEEVTCEGPDNTDVGASFATCNDCAAGYRLSPQTVTFDGKETCAGSNCNESNSDGHGCHGCDICIGSNCRNACSGSSSHSISGTKKVCKKL